MGVRNCNKCGKIYNYDGFPYCSRCRREEEELFQKVKAYIYNNPDATIQEVSEETEVSTKKILNYLRQGRLEVKDGSNLILDCERCGQAIKTGRFCNKCAYELGRELVGAIKNDNKPFRTKKTGRNMNVKDRR
ncbi:MerR family transcriptional regulator [Clostridium sp. D2Q-14]|uniref:TIGR03826 family flagellar region protein n=1 Tax=Anaeromonas gelatinilytica TaxID=2683194 RepID=UPI00193C7A34|nr:TIGR03826 family flagellar region protein [Anaeromonas gelatinilytica]MBS4535790.1 MerR family transcriptional regulator [Anaeromonas gelatinilytica]